MGHLKDYASIEAGYPFRGAIRPLANGDALVVQVKDVDIEGGVDWPNVIRTRLTGRRKPNWLQSGDILFLARGRRFFAVHLEEDPPERAVCSPHFFLIEVTAENLLPAFLAWQINQAPAQSYFARTAEGSHQRSVRRSALDALPVAIPPLDDQRRILELDALARQEANLYGKLIQNRREMLAAIAMRLTS